MLITRKYRFEITWILRMRKVNGFLKLLADRIAMNAQFKIENDVIFIHFRCRKEEEEEEKPKSFTPTLNYYLLDTLKLVDSFVTPQHCSAINRKLNLNLIRNSQIMTQECHGNHMALCIHVILLMDNGGVFHSSLAFPKR